ncbi:MAG: nucleotidyltransferase domain-containing protein [Candidatus Woesearchaeota archaeon]
MINTHKPQLTLLQQRILRLLFVKAGSSLNQRRIAQLLDVSSPAVSKALPDLEKVGFAIVEQDKESKRWSIKLNRDNQHTMQLKRADNITQVYESGLSEALENAFPGDTIILFGSFSRGDDTITSDIDLAIIGSKEKDVNLAKYEKLIGRRITINFFGNFAAIHKNLKENLCNGIVLAGGISL